MNYKISKLEKKLAIKLKSKYLLNQALTHKSKNSHFNNERLEFLGDRVIDLILSEALLDLYPNDKEGTLDKKLSNLVNKRTCASVAKSIELDKYIILGNLYKKDMEFNEKILSDACEALVGAIFIDRGYDYTKRYVLLLWSKNLNKSNVTIVDSKTQLQEYSLRMYKKLPKYNLVNSIGPIHNPTFKMSVQVANSKKFFGLGNSKQEAQQNAADKLLQNIYNA